MDRVDRAMDGSRGDLGPMRLELNYYVGSTA